MATSRDVQATEDFKGMPFEEFYAECRIKKIKKPIHKIIDDIQRVIKARKLRMNGLLLVTQPVSSNTLFRDLSPSIRDYFLQYAHQDGFVNVARTWFAAHCHHRDFVIDSKKDTDASYEVYTQADGSAIFIEQFDVLSYARKENPEEKYKPSREVPVVRSITISHISAASDQQIQAKLIYSKVFVMDKLKVFSQQETKPNESEGNTLFDMSIPEVVERYQQSIEQVEEEINQLIFPLKVFGAFNSFNQIVSQDKNIPLPTPTFSQYFNLKKINEFIAASLFTMLANEWEKQTNILHKIKWDDMERKIITRRFEAHKILATNVIRETIEGYSKGCGYFEMAKINPTLISLADLREKVKKRSNGKEKAYILFQNVLYYFDSKNLVKTTDVTPELKCLFSVDNKLTASDSDSLAMITSLTGHHRCPPKENNLGLQVPTADEVNNLISSLNKFNISIEEMGDVSKLSQAKEITQEVEIFLQFQQALDGALQDFQFIKKIIEDCLQNIFLPEAARLKKDLEYSEFEGIRLELSNLLATKKENSFKKSAEKLYEVVSEVGSLENFDSLTAENFNELALFLLNTTNIINASNLTQIETQITSYKGLIQSYIYGKTATSTTPGTIAAIAGTTLLVAAATATGFFFVAPSLFAAVASVTQFGIFAATAGSGGAAMTAGGVVARKQAQKGKLMAAAEDFLKEAEKLQAQLMAEKKSQVQLEGSNDEVKLSSLKH